MHIIFLDRNIISLMKDFIMLEEIEAKKYGSRYIRYVYVVDKLVANNTGKTREHADVLNLLLNRDVSWNFFSTITSFIEGGYGRTYDVQESKTSLKRDGEIVKKFFHNARTDSNILEYIQNKPENEFCIIKEKMAINYEKYLEDIAPYANDRTINFKEKKTKILNAADNAGIPRSHIIVVCCLSAANGCSVSRSIIKGKKQRPDGRIKYYNAFNDLMVLSRMGQIRALYKPYTYEFITLDKNLSTFISLCPTIDSSNEILEDVVRTWIRCSPKKGLFPGLRQEEFEKLILEDLVVPGTH